MFGIASGKVSKTNLTKLFRKLPREIRGAGYATSFAVRGAFTLKKMNRTVTDAGNFEPAAHAANHLVPSQPCSERSMVTPSGPLNLTSTLPRFAISSVPG